MKHVDDISLSLLKLIFSLPLSYAHPIFTVVPQGPQGSVDKPFLWTEGRVNLKASLNKSAYTHGENVNVTIDVRNDSRKVVRKIRVSFNLLRGIKRRGKCLPHLKCELSCRSTIVSPTRKVSSN